MLGPINSELKRRKSQKENIEFLIKVEEINKLYLEVDIPLPVDVQIKYPQEVAYCFEKINKEVPKLTKDKLKFLKKIGLIKLAFILVVFGLLTTFLIMSDGISIFYQFLISMSLVFGSLLPFMAILNGYIEDYDKKLACKIK